VKTTKSQDTLINPYIGSIIYDLYLHLNVYKTLISVSDDLQRTTHSNKYTREPIIVTSAGGTAIRWP